MLIKQDRNAARQVRHRRLRKRLGGTGERPRLCVFRSGRHIYAQVIDDEQGKTLVASSTLDPELRGKLTQTGNVEAAKAVGQLIAKRALDKGIRSVVFDRGGYLYHGRVAALAEAAREGGLQF